MKQYNINEIKEVFKNDPVPNQWGGFCFGCSKKNDHGLKLNFYIYGNDIENLQCVSKLSIPRYYCGFDGIAQGGYFVRNDLFKFFRTLKESGKIPVGIKVTDDFNMEIIVAEKE